MSLLLLFASSAVSGVDGAASVTFQVSSLDATGREAFDGSGSETIGVVALDASGATFGAAGAVAFSGPSVAATGVETFDAGGAIAVNRPAIAASGAQTFDATGDDTISVVALQGSGSEMFSGAADLVLGGPTLQGSDAAGVDGTGDVTIGVVSVDASGEERIPTGGRRTVIKARLRRPARPKAQPKPKEIPAITGRAAMRLGGDSIEATGGVALPITGDGTARAAVPSVTARLVNVDTYRQARIEDSELFDTDIAA